MAAVAVVSVTLVMFCCWRRKKNDERRKRSGRGRRENGYGAGGGANGGGEEEADAAADVNKIQVLFFRYTLSALVFVLLSLLLLLLLLSSLLLLWMIVVVSLEKILEPSIHLTSLSSVLLQTLGKQYRVDSDAEGARKFSILQDIRNEEAAAAGAATHNKEKK